MGPRLSLVLGFCSTALLPALASGQVQVFILAGQSNMEGKAAASTLEPVLRDAETRERFQHLQTDGQWTVRKDVFVTFLDRQETPVSPLHGPLSVGFGSPKRVRDESGARIMVAGIGPELGIGWVLGEHFEQPVLLIKAAWGGRAVRHTFRPPSAMPTEEQLQQRLVELRKKDPAWTLEALRESYGRDYRRILDETDRVLRALGTYVPGYDASLGYRLAGFIWFQGWNDGVGGGNPDYVEQMAHFIRDIRRDLQAPQLPFVIGQLGIDGLAAEGWIAEFRRQQSALAAMREFQDTVRLVETAAYWPDPPDLSEEWEQFRAAARINEQKSQDDPSRITPGDFYLRNWVFRYRDQLAYTSDKRYHYLGSGRCYYEMGEAMGRGMLELIK